MKESFLNIPLEELEVPALALKKIADKQKHPVILLTGEMGAGKTTFTSVLVKLYGIAENANSPTFNLYNVYKSFGKEIYHFDLYRLRDATELDNIEVEEIWGKQGISIIEWWQIAKDFLPENTIEVRITTVDFDHRDIEIISR